HLDGPAEGRHPESPAKHRILERDIDEGAQILAVDFEDRVGMVTDGDQRVARLSAELARLTQSTQPDLFSGLDSGGNRDCDLAAPCQCHTALAALGDFLERGLHFEVDVGAARAASLAAAALSPCTSPEQLGDDVLHAGSSACSGARAGTTEIIGEMLL